MMPTHSALAEGNEAAARKTHVLHLLQHMRTCNTFSTGASSMGSLN